MASLYITEYEQMARSDQGEVIPVGLEPAAAVQKVTFTTSTASAAFSNSTTILRLLADADFHIQVAKAPTATANTPLYKANTEYHIGVKEGLSLKIAAYDGTS